MMETANSSTLSETTDRNDDRVVECPCQKFAAMSKIVEVLDSQDDCMKSLLSWLGGETDDIALKRNQPLSCGKRSRCRFRYGTSFAILNSIRDACRPYLEPISSADFGTSTEGFSSGAAILPAVTYEEAFPALHTSKLGPLLATKPHPASSNILVPRKKSEAKQVKVTEVNLVPVKKKAKRRIRPQPAGLVVTNNSVWGQQQSKSATPSESSHGNIASLPSQDPITPVKKIKCQENKAILLANTDSVKAFENQQTTEASNATHPHEPKLPETVPEAVPEGRVQQLVEIYIALIENLLIPSTALELHLLIRLLTVDPDTRNLRSSTELNAEPIFFQPVFSGPDRCRLFARLVLSRMNLVLRRLSGPLVKLLVQCAPFRRECPKLTEDLNLVLEERARQGLLVDYPPEDITGTHAILSLPFEHERDSRHNYKTQSELAIYKNREESRDAFLYLLRTFMSSKGKVLHSRESEKAQERLQEGSKNMMNGLLSVNMVWFAQFFCELLLQVGLSPVEETDEELLSIADKDKLQVSTRDSHFSFSFEIAH
jgi:hypothetical protein